MLKPYALRLPTATATAARGLTPRSDCLEVLLKSPCTVLCSALYTACVDASRMVFWDRSLLTYLLFRANKFILTIDEWTEEKLLEKWMKKDADRLWESVVRYVYRKRGLKV